MNFSGAVKVGVTKEYIAVSFDLEDPEAMASLERHVAAFPRRTRVEMIEGLAILYIYPGGARDIVR